MRVFKKSLAENFILLDLVVVRIAIQYVRWLYILVQC